MDKYKNFSSIIRFNYIEDNTHGVIKRSPYPYQISMKNSDLGMTNNSVDANQHVNSNKVGGQQSSLELYQPKSFETGKLLKSSDFDGDFSIAKIKRIKSISELDDTYRLKEIQEFVEYLKKQKGSLMRVEINIVYCEQIQCVDSLINY